MCGCESSFVCSRCAGTPQDYRYFLDEEPESVHDLRDRDKSEYTDLVVAPAVARASSVRQTR